MTAPLVRGTRRGLAGTDIAFRNLRDDLTHAISIAGARWRIVPMLANRKDNGFISVQEALKRGISRAALYRIMKPKRKGAPVKVRSKTDYRGRRLVFSRDLMRHLRSENHQPPSRRR
jgi:hypothetical protein